MERKIGEIFEYNGGWYQCVKSQDGSCKHCDMNFEGKCPIPIKECTESGRSDKSYVIFKKLEKVGEPYKYFIQGMGIIMVQEYILANANYIWEYNQDVVVMDCQNEKVAIEIKQNKEDMEENYKAEDTPLTRLVGRYVNNLLDYKTFEEAVKELYSNKEEIKPTLKPFDLEAAKAGKSVCTRDGRKARIICFDRKSTMQNSKFKIIALITENGGENLIGFFDEYGKDFEDNDNRDLMMLPEKHEGWVNIYQKEQNRFPKGIFPSKDKAIEAISEIGRKYIDTVKISWEE